MKKFIGLCTTLIICIQLISFEAIVRWLLRMQNKPTDSCQNLFFIFTIILTEVIAILCAIEYEKKEK